MSSPEGLSMIWLIPGFPILAAILLTLWPTHQRRGAAWIGIGAMALSLVGASIAFLAIASAPGEEGLVRWVHNFLWFDMGESPIKIGWLLDPLSAVMLWMVTFVSLLVLIYSSGYMANDQRMVRFFAFLSLFAGAMLGLLISNHLLVLFMCWEVVGLASYLLIGFWFHKPSAAAACKKAFITTRIGDLGLLLGLLWLYRDTGTLLFYDGGEGCLEDRSIVWLAGLPGMFGMTATATIGILLFVGAMGKSGQFPLHVWLPDAMEGPTPVSALIHAATMVAAGVFLMARIHPLLEFPAAGTQALDLITWIGAITALGGALVACAQQDLKRILAFSTISQLGYMMLGLGTGGVAVAMFHLITHAFFKALLFLGAGSVIHGCHDQQDIRYMGGLRKCMPTTFIAYGIGMLALAGFPLVTAGFWSKDLILHAALHWHGGMIPFAMGLLGALLTAFYMTRQMSQVFFGRYRGDEAPDQATSSGKESPHESPASMLWPLRILAVFAIGAGFMGTPVYPWFESFLEGQPLVWQPGELVHGSTLLLLIGSSCLVLLGLFFGWWYYSPLVYDPTHDDDPMEERLPAGSFAFLRAKAYLDEAYQYTFLRWTQHLAIGCRWVENHFFRPMMPLVATFTQLISWLARFWDEWIINAGFDFTCSGIMIQAGKMRRMHQKRVQICLQWMAAAAILLLLILKLGGAS